MKKFWFILTGLILAGITFSSSVHGVDSGYSSMRIAMVVQSILPIDAGMLNFLVRKTAHFVVYFVLGFCFFNYAKFEIKQKKPLFFLSWGFASVFGVFDEIHQYFVPGRVCAISDMLINSAGALAGVTCAMLVYSFYKIRKTRPDLLKP